MPPGSPRLDWDQDEKVFDRSTTTTLTEEGSQAVSSYRKFLGVFRCLGGRNKLESEPHELHFKGQLDTKISYADLPMRLSINEGSSSSKMRIFPTAFQKCDEMHYYLEMIIPGFSKEHVSIVLYKNKVSISGSTLLQSKRDQKTVTTVYPPSQTPARPLPAIPRKHTTTSAVPHRVNIAEALASPDPIRIKMRAEFSMTRNFSSTITCTPYPEDKIAASCASAATITTPEHGKAMLPPCLKFFQKTIRMPCDVDWTRIEATVRDGVLYMTFARLSPAGRKKIFIM